jgi:predicted O-methyltransferase YrrM
MYSPFHLAFKYLRYYLNASSGKGHGVHSPFVFDFITKVLNDKRNFYAYEAIEQVRQKLLLNKEKITVEDFGAGSAVHKSRERTIRDIARHSAKKPKYGQLLFRIAEHYDCKKILELGTSLGLSTAYLAAADPYAKVITLEGAPAIAAIARKNFEALNLFNTELIQGNFDETLAAGLQQLSSPNLVFFDGNHRKEPTLRYFHQCLEKAHHNSIFIFDDIHWSSEMEEAWASIRSHPSVTCSIDLFFTGLVFFRDEFKTPQHFTIRF